ncbi:MAG: acetyl-CoA hydrolase/transferase C-terminal domain-containing protein, partial [Pseudomonadales bacterium]
MTARPPARFEDAEACADALIARLSGHVRLAIPLGLGKPVRLVNALYRRARADSGIDLQIFTALTLERPVGRSDLERRLLRPLVERLYADVPELDYAADRRRGRLPANVRVEEFFLRPGAWLGVAEAQRHYASLNYTHAARDLASRGVNLVAQLVAPGTDGTFSLSCNPDVTLDLLDALRQAGAPAPLLAGEVNPALPFMGGDAALAADRFDALLASADTGYPLFPVPNRAASLAEHAIALRVAALVRDGGTLQVGIGSIGDAVAHAIALRHRDNDRYRALLAALPVAPQAAELAPFTEGLYGSSEMLVEGFLHLREAGVLRRTDPDGVYLHAGFFLGSAGFYGRLRAMPEAERAGIGMTRISVTNSLLGDEAGRRRQRRDARFVNSVMLMTLLGAAVSDGLEDGRVVSGVGGQYNFVAMAHELAGARSILVLPATRNAGGTVSSNIVWRYGHVTIPRHLRDLVVTEYGCADLRGATDEDVVIRLLNIADSRFQEGLRRAAVQAGKLPAAYRIPARFRRNTPAALAAAWAAPELARALPHYPLGTDLDDTEAALAVALEALAELRGDRLGMLRALRRGWPMADAPHLQP